MSDHPTEKSTVTEETAGSEAIAPAAIAQMPTPQRCLVGSVIAGALAYAMYLMTTAIAQSFAAHKIQSTSLIVQRLSSAVRTLVIGMTTLGTGVFGFAAVGLLLLGIQIVFQRYQASTKSNPD